jgi:hypothetical protein
MIELANVIEIMSVPKAMDTRCIGQLGQYIDTRVTKTTMRVMGAAVAGCEGGCNV